MKTQKLWNCLLLLSAAAVFGAFALRRGNIADQTLNLLRDAAFLVFCASLTMRVLGPEQKLSQAWPCFVLIALALFNLGSTILGF